MYFQDHQLEWCTRMLNIINYCCLHLSLFFFFSLLSLPSFPLPPFLSPLSSLLFLPPLSPSRSLHLPLLHLIATLILYTYYETVATTTNKLIADAIAALAYGEPQKEGGAGVINTSSFDRREVVELPAGIKSPQVSHNGKPLGRCCLFGCAEFDLVRVRACAVFCFVLFC